MKGVVLILTVFLSLLNSCGKVGATGTASWQETAVICEDSGSAKSPDHIVPKDMCITSPQGWAFSGSENESPVSMRAPQGGRRINPSTKDTTRLVRTGKVIDTHNFNMFLSAQFSKADGAQSFFRYIYAICCLRL